MQHGVLSLTGIVAVSLLHQSQCRRKWIAGWPTERNIMPDIQGFLEYGPVRALETLGIHGSMPSCDGCWRLLVLCCCSYSLSSAKQAVCRQLQQHPAIHSHTCHCCYYQQQLYPRANLHVELAQHCNPLACRYIKDLKDGWKTINLSVLF